MAHRPLHVLGDGSRHRQGGVRLRCLQRVAILQRDGLRVLRGKSFRLSERAQQPKALYQASLVLWVGGKIEADLGHSVWIRRGQAQHTA
jgi:hypothetical protein